MQAFNGQHVEILKTYGIFKGLGEYSRIYAQSAATRRETSTRSRRWMTARPVPRDSDYGLAGRSKKRSSIAKRSKIVVLFIASGTMYSETRRKMGW